VFDLTDKKSFEKVQSWIHSVKEFSNLNDCMILLGNKVDLENNREISNQEAELLSERYNIKYFETSAKENTNVDEAFLNIISQISEKIKPIDKNFKLNSVETNKSCCI
jgi:GTPase SAR1 family protein